MSQQTVCGADATAALRQEYLTAAIVRQESLAHWKKLEARRRFLGIAAVICSIAALVAAVAVFFPYRGAIGGVHGLLYAAIPLGIGALLVLALLLVRLGVSAASCKVYMECYSAELLLAEASDAIKKQTVDPVLENAIVISARSLIKADPYGYAEPLHVSEADTDAGKKIQKYKRATAKGADSAEIINTPVNFAKVFIDGTAAGSLDLSRDFSVFRVTPGIHKVTLHLRKDYANGKSIELDTAPMTLIINGSYRVLLYTLEARFTDGKLAYALKVAEYDDMTTFRRDTWNTDQAERLEREEELSPRLSKRAEALYRSICERNSDSTEWLDQEGRRYKRRKNHAISEQNLPISDEVLRPYQTNAKVIAKKMLITQHDPSLKDSTREKRLAALERELDALARKLYDEVKTSDNAYLAQMETRKLKAILLLGREHARCEELVEELHRETTV